MKNILVTGGSGYIGSHTIHELLKTKLYNITVLDDFKNGNKQALTTLEKFHKTSIEIVEGSILNQKLLSETFKNHSFDAVIHFAALIEAGKSVIDPLRFYANNTSGSINLLQAMQSHLADKIVFSSTAAVYGTPKLLPVNEETELNPENPYGDSKLAVERILQSLQNSHVEKPIQSVILRYFNAAGAEENNLIGQDYPNPTHLMTVAIQAALGQREKLTIFGNDYDTPDGTCIRDYIHVSDLAIAHVKALEHILETRQSNIFNVGTGTGTSNLEVIKMIEAIHGKFNWEIGERRPGDPAALTADNSKIKEVLNWSPQFSVHDTVQHAYSWLQTHPEGY